MSEKNSKGLSISFRVDSGFLDHNNLVITAHNVDISRTSDNITYTKIDLHDFYEQIFGEALAEYNAKQKRADREIPDYYEHVKKSGKGKLFYEAVVQFGDLHDCGVGSENWNTAKSMLNEYMLDFEKRNPNLKVFNAVMHLDESTPHLHIDFVPVAHKGQRGMPLKNSMSGALREQGFSSSNRMENEWTAWSESERSFMEQILLKHGLRREDKNVHRPHLSVEDYKRAALEAERIRKTESSQHDLRTHETAYPPHLSRNRTSAYRQDFSAAAARICELPYQRGCERENRQAACAENDTAQSLFHLGRVQLCGEDGSCFRQSLRKGHDPQRRGQGKANLLAGGT